MRGLSTGWALVRVRVGPAGMLDYLRIFFLFETIFCLSFLFLEIETEEDFPLKKIKED